MHPILRMRHSLSIPHLLLVVFALLAASAYADPVPVRYLQGTTHGFLIIKDAHGARIANGDFTQVVRGEEVTSRISFHFADGSIDEDTAVYSQHGSFRLISDHHVQHGPRFSKPFDIAVNVASGQVVFHAEDGSVRQDHMDLPDDLANGLLSTLLANTLPSDGELKLSFLAPTAKPRLVHLAIKSTGDAPLTTAGKSRKAVVYAVHVDIGGVSGVVAPIIGKQPEDMHIWILKSEVPDFLREDAQFFEGGPIWHVEQVSAVFPK